jgi:hypothetical protein
MVKEQRYERTRPWMNLLGKNKHNFRYAKAWNNYELLMAGGHATTNKS